MFEGLGGLHAEHRDVALEKCEVLQLPRQHQCLVGAHQAPRGTHETLAVRAHPAGGKFYGQEEAGKSRTLLRGILRGVDPHPAGYGYGRRAPPAVRTAARLH